MVMEVDFLNKSFEIIALIKELKENFKKLWQRILTIQRSHILNGCY